MKRIETKQAIKVIYKSSVISGSVMIANDAAKSLQFRTSTPTPFGLILRNLSSSAIGYSIGKKAADITWNAIETAIARYNEEV